MGGRKYVDGVPTTETIAADKATQSPAVIAAQEKLYALRAKENEGKGNISAADAADQVSRLYGSDPTEAPDWVTD